MSLKKLKCGQKTDARKKVNKHYTATTVANSMM